MYLTYPFSYAAVTPPTCTPTAYVPNWHQVLYQDQIGYVSAKYCRLTSIITKTIPVSDDR